MSAIAVFLCMCLLAQMVLADVIHFTEETQGEKVTVIFHDGTRTEGRILDYTDDRLKIATESVVLEFPSDSVWLVTNPDGDLILPLKKKASTLPCLLAGGGCVVLGVLGAVAVAAVAITVVSLRALSAM